MPTADAGASTRAPSARYPATLLAVFLVWWTILAIAPKYRQDWLLENILVFLSVPIIVWTYRSLRFTNVSYTCLFVFFSLHVLGAHYTYSEVPYDHWMRSATGTTITAIGGFSRNHFDRLVHFSYGFLMLPVAAEIFEARARPQGIWRWLMPVLFISSHGAIYEVIEWLAAARFSPELGQAYVGMQGDIWDAQKDMAMVMVGAALSMTLLSAWRRRSLRRRA